MIQCAGFEANRKLLKKRWSIAQHSVVQQHILVIQIAYYWTFAESTFSVLW